MTAKRTTLDSKKQIVVAVVEIDPESRVIDVAHIPEEDLQKVIGECQNALNWLADELQREDQDGLCQFMLYLAIASADASAKHLRFRVLDRRTVRAQGKEIGETTYTLRGKRYRLIMEVFRDKGNT